MSDRLTMAAVRFAANVDRLDDIADILEGLHQLACIAGLNAFGAWRVPPWARRDDRRSYVIATHPSVPAKFYAEYWELYAKNGRSFLANLAWRNRGAFTMSEALRIVKPSGHDRWLQQLLFKYGMRDIFYVPNGDIMVVYWSAKPLRFDTATRAALAFAGNATAARLQAIFARKGKVEPDPGLSSRQRAVLRLVSHGMTLHEAGEHLGIGYKTVAEHAGRAARKLKAKNLPHAVAEALRRYVVITWLAAMTLATAAGLCDVHHPCWITHILQGRHSHVPGSTRVGL